MKNRVISIAIIAMLMLSIVAIFPATKAKAANSIYIDQESISFNTDTTDVGYRFNVTFWMNLTEDCYDWQVKMSFNYTWLNCTKAGYSVGTTAGRSQYFEDLAATSPQVAQIHNEVGYVMDGESSQGVEEASAADKKLMFVELNITQKPSSGVTFTSTLDIVNDLTYAEDYDTNQLVTDNGKYGGYVEYVGAVHVPQPTHLEVSPTSTVFVSTTVAVGLEFDIAVTAKAVDSGWNMVNATFELNYTCATPPPTQLLTITSVTKGPIWGSIAFDNLTTVGIIDVNVTSPSGTPQNDVLLATIRFRVLYQDVYPIVDNAPLIITPNGTCYGAGETLIPTNAPVNGNVVVNGFGSPPPYFSVSSKTMGPGNVLGQQFNITVTINGVDPSQILIGYDFRLQYNTTLITPVAVYEGPFMPYWSNNQTGSIGTFFTNFLEPGPPDGPHVLVAGMIYPDGTGYWNQYAPEPINASFNVVAIITFEVAWIGYSVGDANQTGALDIYQQHFFGLDNWIDQNPISLGASSPHNGTYTILTTWPGRVIDVYTQYPAPYGGQGPNMPSDMFWPQKQPIFYANVTYNFWPVQQKDVAFEIRDNFRANVSEYEGDPYVAEHGNLVDIEVARTDANGVACVSMRIPWPCDNPEQYFGVWTVTATVDVACVVINDTVQFHFDYMVEIFKVTVDRPTVPHNGNWNFFDIDIEYGSHAQQEYPVIFYVVLKDELNVPVGMDTVTTTVGGTVFCQYKNGTINLRIHIPKWAYAGVGHVYVTAYNMLPSSGGTAWCPTYGLTGPFGYSWPPGSTLPSIIILPS